MAVLEVPSMDGLVPFFDQEMVTMCLFESPGTGLTLLCALLNLDLNEDQADKTPAPSSLKRSDSFNVLNPPNLSIR
jgi:hypothetical protein